MTEVMIAALAGFGGGVMAVVVLTAAMMHDARMRRSERDVRK